MLSQYILTHTHTHTPYSCPDQRTTAVVALLLRAEQILRWRDPQGLVTPNITESIACRQREPAYHLRTTIVPVTVSLCSETKNHICIQLLTPATILGVSCPSAAIGTLLMGHIPIVWSCKSVSLRPREESSARLRQRRAGRPRALLKLLYRLFLSYSHGLLFKVLKFKWSAARSALPSAIDMRNIAGPPDPPARSLAYERCHKIAKEQSRRREKRDRGPSPR